MCVCVHVVQWFFIHVGILSDISKFKWFFTIVSLCSLFMSVDFIIDFGVSVPDSRGGVVEPDIWSKCLQRYRLYWDGSIKSSNEFSVYPKNRKGAPDVLLQKFPSTNFWVHNFGRLEHLRKMSNSIKLRNEFLLLPFFIPPAFDLIYNLYKIYCTPSKFVVLSLRNGLLS